MARVDISNVAARVGVLLAAVAFAMNGSGSLSEETRARMLETANELASYRPNRTAWSLKCRWTKTIALQVSGQNHRGKVHRDAFSSFQGELLNAASTAALKMGNLLVVIPESTAKVMGVRGLPLDVIWWLTRTIPHDLSHSVDNTDEIDSIPIWQACDDHLRHSSGPLMPGSRVKHQPPCPDQCGSFRHRRQWSLP